jgi:hypothetical protein
MKQNDKCTGSHPAQLDAPVFLDVVERLKVLNDWVEALNAEVDGKLRSCLGDDFIPSSKECDSDVKGGSSLKDLLHDLLVKATDNASDYERLMKNLRKLI